MASTTKIVNIALARISVERISSLESGREKAARVARDLFDEAREELLRRHTWSFATRRVELAKAAGAGSTPAFGYDYAYHVPSDMLRIISVHPYDSDQSSTKYRVESQLISGTPTRVILTNPEQIFLRYVAQVTDVNLMTAEFRSVLSAHLAVDLARSMDRSASDIETLKGELREKMATARSIDGIEDDTHYIPDGTWVTVRGRDDNYDNWGE